MFTTSRCYPSSKRVLCAICSTPELCLCARMCACMRDRQTGRQGVGVEAQGRIRLRPGQELWAACRAQATRAKPEGVFVGCWSTWDEHKQQMNKRRRHGFNQYKAKLESRCLVYVSNQRS